MDNIEEKFYKTFGIEQEYQYHVRDRGRSYVGKKQMLIDKKHLFMDKERKRSRSLYVANVSKIYPKITDRILLELICICNSTYINGYTNYFMTTGKTKEELKEEILKKCITLSKDIKNKIKQQFKGGE